ncbi:hypothetical protein [Lentibacillus amyloliquefaciens]|uniref:DUF485 domain-containing protein n=1 Tax=Lentibacillus amyloliquefaciens TaxID=1472767 RepID=A0A0U3WKD1_9BACI|nr:hypothetical protein [Lentibacillus amyloliquefaciens]ALX50287.1 hypothetical protein AOX59_17910 [Lentibacillus amyloliquefaciens]
MNKLKRFFIIYASVFAFIWIGYGLFSVVTGKPSANLILGYGIAFSIVIFAASWFAYWLMGHYKKVDKMAKDILTKK